MMQVFKPLIAYNLQIIETTTTMIIKGKITAKMPIQTGTSQSGKDWIKGGFVIETAREYPKKVCLTTFNRAIHDAATVGSSGEFHIDIEAREYNEKWYTTVKCYKMDLDKEA
jgi:hypothetical protein